MGDFFDALGRKTGSPEAQAYAEKCYLSFDTPWLIRLTSTATDFYLNNALYNEDGEISCKQGLINSRFYISLFHNMPLTIDIGDLNWGLPKDPYSLAIGYDFFLEKTIFLKRTRKTQEAYYKQD